MIKFFRSRSLVSIMMTVVVSFAVVVLAANAASTISTNISTDGSLTVGTISTLTGDVAAAGALTVGTTLGVTGATTLATTTIGASKPVVFGTATSNLGGASEGSVYYNSTSKLLRLYDGTNWVAVATSTGGSGLSVSGGRINLTDVTSYLTIGTSTQTGLSVFTLTSTTTDSIPLTVRGEVGQTANLIQVQNIAGTELFAIDSAGNASSTMVTYSGPIWANGNVTLGNAASDLVVITGNASTTNALTVGGNLYVTGTSALTGNATAAGTLAVTGNFNVNGNATTTASTGNITTIGKFGAGTSTPSTEISALGAATTTLYLSSSAAGGCIQLTGSDGTTIYRAYATTTGPLILSVGACK